MLDVNYIVNLYINIKRNVLKNRFIQVPKDGHKFTEDMTEVRDKIEELHADPVGFIKFMVKYYSPMRIFPSPRHLLAEKAINKFRYHQALTNQYNYEDVSFDKDDVFIHESMDTVSYKNEWAVPIDQDVRLRFAIHIAKENRETYTQKELKDIIYAIAKLKYFNKPMIVELLDAKEKMDAKNLL